MGLGCDTCRSAGPVIHPGHAGLVMIVVMDTIMIEHKMGDMLDYDLIEENP